MIPFEMNTELWAIIAGLPLSKEEIKEEALTAYESAEIDEIDYNRILTHIGL